MRVHFNIVEASLGPDVTLWLDLLGPWVFLLLWLWCWQECAGGDWKQPAALNYEWISSTVSWDERPMAPVADVNLSSLAYCSRLHQEMKPRAGTTSYWCFLACRVVEVYVNYLRCSILQSSNQYNKVSYPIEMIRSPLNLSSLSCELNIHFALKVSRYHASSAAQIPTKFQSDQKI